jgi:hypothetical protein
MGDGPYPGFPGVTKRGVDTLVSRRVAPFVLSGTAEVVCPHGRAKRKTVELHLDLRVEMPSLCRCCENLYARSDDETGLPCPTCEPPLGGLYA